MSDIQTQVFPVPYTTPPQVPAAPIAVPVEQTVVTAAPVPQPARFTRYPK